MKKEKIYDLRKGLELGELGDRLVDYDGGYIQDIFAQIADSAIDNYSCDLLDWAKENLEYIEEANIEFGIPENANIIKQIQHGQYYYYEQDLYNNQEDIIKNWILNYIEHYLKIERITEQQKESIFKNIDYDLYLEDVKANIEGIFKDNI